MATTASDRSSDASDSRHPGSSDIRSLALDGAGDAGALLDGIADALALFDADDRLIRCNRAFLRLLGAGDERALLGSTALELLDAWLPNLVLNGETDRKRLVQLQTRTLDERGVSFDVHTKDGQRLRVTDRSSGVNGRVRTIWNLTGGVRTGLSGSAGDVPAGATAATLELLSAMSRNALAPLNAMLGFAQLMHSDRREPLSARQRARLEEILRAGAQLTSALDDAVDLARLESGREPLTLQPVNALIVLRGVVSALEPEAAQRGSSVWLEAPPGSVPPVLTDAERLAKILRIFGSNAVKFNRAKGAARFCVALSTPGSVRLSVHDNGDGVPLERQAQLFGSCEDPDEGAEPRGTGLALAKHLADLLGASIGFRSRPGAGSEFWIELAVA